MTPETQKMLMDVLKVQPQSVAAPIRPSIGTNPVADAYFNYIQDDPVALQVSGGDPLKRLLRFASEFVPGVSTELAKRRGDKLGEALSYLDVLGAASVPAKAVAKGVDATTDITKDMMFLHNTTQGALQNYESIGGLPSPSIAVTQKDIPFTGFGDITLVGNPKNFDPSTNVSNKVYSADAYTPRSPKKIRLAKQGSSKKFLKDYKDMDEYEVTRVANALESLESKNPSMAKDNYEFLDEYLFSPTYQFPFMKKKFLKETKTKENDFSQVKYKDWLAKEKEKYLSNEGVFEYWDEIDQTTRTMPYTLDNVVNNMVADTQRGGETIAENAVITPNMLRGLLSEEFPSLQAIKSQKSRLAEKNKYYTIDDFEDELIEPLYKVTKNPEDSVQQLIANVGTNLRLGDKLDSAIKSAFEYTYGLPNNPKQEVVDSIAAKFIENAKRPSPYFEAKPTRAVGLDEFAGAIVPEATPKETLDLLKSYGIKIEKYDPSLQISRTQARNKFGDQMFNYLLPTPLLAGAIASQDND